MCASLLIALLQAQAPASANCQQHTAQHLLPAAKHGSVNTAPAAWARPHPAETRRIKPAQVKAQSFH